jgi:hypothetical protein
MRIITALTSGLVGASALTLIHETVRRVLPQAPRVDILGMRAIAQGARQVGQDPPSNDRLFRWALLGDLFGNTVYYSLIGLGNPQDAPRRGLLLGLGAGIGAVVLPPLLGLGTDTQARTPLTQILTVAWYLIGGLTAAATARRLGSST